MKRIIALSVLAFAVLMSSLSGPSARADQIASNITGTDLGVWGIHEGFWSGIRFTTDANPWIVDNVVAPVSQGLDRSLSGIFIQVYTNVAGQPGSPLGSKMVTPTITNVVADQTFTRVGPGAALAPSTTYWMVLGVDDPLSNANPIYRRTNLTPGGGPGTMGLTIWSSQNDGVSWSFQSPGNEFESIRMQINGTLVPEPSGLLSVGIALVALRRRVPAHRSACVG